MPLSDLKYWRNYGEVFMKSDKFKSIVLFYATVIGVMLIALVFAFSVYGVHFTGSVANAIGSATPKDEANTPKIVLYSTPSELSKDNAYQEFTVTVRIDGVASVNGGVYGASVRITPENASSLDFIGFVSNNEIPQSALIRGSNHEEGIDVAMEGQCNGATPLTENFVVGGFKFKLKQGASIPNSITFNYSDIDSADFLSGTKLRMSSGSFTINIVDTSNPDEPGQGGSDLPTNPGQGNSGDSNDINNSGNLDNVENTENPNGLTTGAIAGISVGGVSFVGIIITIILIVLKKKKKEMTE